MSSIVNKVKEALHHDKDESKHTTDNKHTTHTTEPRTGTTTTTGAGIGSHDGSYTTGDNYGLGGNNRGTDGPATRTDGPHSSNVANKVDPRVDSDRDHSKNLGANPHGTATTGSHSTTTGTTTGATSGFGGTTGHSTTTAGPHSSNLANKTDPRVDSDLDGSRNLGASSTTHGTSGLTGTTGTHGTGHHSGGYAAGAGNPLGTGAVPAAHQQASHGTHNTSGLATGTAAGIGAGAAGHHATSGTHTHGGTTIGDNRGFDGPASKTDGPHSSNLANKIDPRVDSDRDHSKNLGANPHGTATTGNTTSTSTTHGTSGSGAFFTGSDNTTHGATGTHSTVGNTGLGNTGTHATHGSSGLTGTHGTTGLTGTHNTTGTSGLTGTTGTHSTTSGAPEGTFGPHGSRVANAADPRVDSDRDNRGNIGGTGVHHSGVAGTTGTHGTSGLTSTHGTTGTHNTSGLTGTHGTTGTHNTSGLTGTHGTTGTTTGAAGGLAGSTHPGPAPNTAGPHKSDMLNKVDPRVDSDRDGSKTLGGDKTTTTTGSSMAHKDPTDAAQVPPSVLQKHVGGVQVAHDDHTHDRERRHSVSHQEQHRGL